jgi:hypothetical protein
MTSGFGAAVESELAVQFERAELLREVPELRAAMLDEFSRTLVEIANLIAERSGRAPGDDEVLACAGAVIGVSIAAWLGGGEGDWSARFLGRLDSGMALLESGFRL